MTLTNRSPLRVLAFALGFLPAATGVVIGQEERAETEKPDEPRILLQAFPQRDQIITVRSRSTYEDRLSEISLRQGEEILLPFENGEVPFSVGRAIEVDRLFLDRIQQVDLGTQGPPKINALQRLYSRLEYVVRSREEKTARGAREQREVSDLVNKPLRVNRTGDKITASVDQPPQQRPGSPPPEQPPQEDLALLRLHAHLESVLPGRTVAVGETWPLDELAVQSLLGCPDGYPLPRAADVFQVDESVPRGNDPIAVFTSLGKVEAQGELVSFDADGAKIRVTVTVLLEGAKPYRIRKVESEDGADSEPRDETKEAAAEGADEASQFRDQWLWNGKLAVSGTVEFSIRQRAVTRANLEGTLDVTIQGKGPEGPGQIEFSARNRGTLKHAIDLTVDAS